MWRNKGQLLGEVAAPDAEAAKAAAVARFDLDEVHATDCWCGSLVERPTAFRRSVGPGCRLDPENLTICDRYHILVAGFWSRLPL
jgi:hypothetical protein